MRKTRRRVRVRRVKTACPFCQEKFEPDWKKEDVLSRYLSERGRILGKGLTGLCAKHQRRVTREIKRARFMALLPFVAQVK